MRLFVGLPVPDTARSRLAAPIESALTLLPPRAHRSDPRDWHLTLEFLGMTTTERLEALAAALGTADLGYRFELCTAAFGAFPSNERARIVWLGVGGDGLAELERLQRRVAKLCASVGHMPDSRPYAPHVTLARYDRGFDGRLFIASAQPEVTPLPVESVIVYESVQGATPRYHARYVIKLPDAPGPAKIPK